MMVGWLGTITDIYCKTFFWVLFFLEGYSVCIGARRGQGFLASFGFFFLPFYYLLLCFSRDIFLLCF